MNLFILQPPELSVVPAQPVKMKKVRVSKASRNQLNWLAAKIEGLATEPYLGFPMDDVWDPCGEWYQGGPLIEKRLLSPSPRKDSEEKLLDWECYNWHGEGETYFGHSFLVAGIRCFVASYLGSQTEVPADLK